MGSNVKGIVSRYGKPGVLTGVAGTGGILIEDYARSNGGSLAAYIKDTVSEGAKTLGPIIGDIMDEIGKSTVNYVAQNPAQAVLAGMGILGSVIIGIKEGYIKNPFK